MSPTYLALVSLLLLAIVAGLVALLWWGQRQQAQQVELHIDQALEWKTATPVEAPLDTFAAPSNRLEQALRDLLRSGFGKALLAEEDRTLLEQAGWTDEKSRAYYVGARVGCAALLVALTLLLHHDSLLRQGMAGFMGFAFGLLLPKWLLRARAKSRHTQLHKEIPLLVDLLRLLQGTGMSLDMSLRVTATEFQDILPVMAHELDIANRQYAAGRTRNDSLRRLIRLYGKEDLDELVTLLVQIDKHGGAVQEPMRQYAARLREKRRSKLREIVGKLNVKMTLVMITALLPALMIIIAGPAVQAIMRGLAGVGK